MRRVTAKQLPAEPTQELTKIIVLIRKRERLATGKIQVVGLIPVPDSRTDTTRTQGVHVLPARPPVLREWQFGGHGLPLLHRTILKCEGRRNSLDANRRQCKRRRRFGSQPRLKPSPHVNRTASIRLVRAIWRKSLRSGLHLAAALETAERRVSGQRPICQHLPLSVSSAGDYETQNMQSRKEQFLHSARRRTRRIT